MYATCRRGEVVRECGGRGESVVRITGATMPWAPGGALTRNGIPAGRVILTNHFVQNVGARR